jgi:hypothetical protein
MFCKKELHGTKGGLCTIIGIIKEIVKNRISIIFLKYLYVPTQYLIMAVLRTLLGIWRVWK